MKDHNKDIKSLFNFPSLAFNQEEKNLGEQRGNVVFKPTKISQPPGGGTWYAYGGGRLECWP
jgi:hypothetical protein